MWAGARASTPDVSRGTGLLGMRRFLVHGSQRPRAERHTRWQRRVASTTWRTAPGEAGEGRAPTASRGQRRAQSSDGDLAALPPLVVEYSLAKVARRQISQDPGHTEAPLVLGR